MRHLLIAGWLTAAATLAAAPPVTVDLAARAIQPGEVVQLTMTVAPAVDQVRVAAVGHPQAAFRVSPTTWRVLIGIDLDTRAGAHDVTIETGRPDAAEKTTYP